jgi:hypothetical protein
VNLGINPRGVFRDLLAAFDVFVVVGFFACAIVVVCIGVVSIARAIHSDLNRPNQE